MEIGIQFVLKDINFECENNKELKRIEISKTFCWTNLNLSSKHSSYVNNK